MVDIATPLASFLKRPPTPPKERPTKNEGHSTIHNVACHRLLDTPDESPSSSAEYFNASSGKLRKRVGFSGWTRYHRPLSAAGRGYDSDELRPLPPSRDCKSSKSILKQSLDTTPTTLSTFDKSDFPTMLRSTTLHLASDSRASRLDAYTTILACLSAYEDVPEAKEMVERVGEITEYIRRDITAQKEDQSVDSQLATQALKLLAVLIYLPNTANALPEDFCSFVVERSFACIEAEKPPKIMVSHYMHILEKQRFGPKVMTADRVNRLLTVLDEVTNRTKGNRVVGHRLMIYQRLLAQAKPIMATRTWSWIDHLISGMLSTIKDIRTRAIGLGVQAGLILGSTVSVSQTCIDVFNRKSPEGTKVIEFIVSRLTDMTNSKEDAPHVPQIWSVVILFLRSRRRQVECWEHLKSWLVIIQRCFNSSEPQVKFQANIAWNRLIFAVNIDVSTSKSMTRMLRQAIVSQLERKMIDSQGNDNIKQAKQIARSTYCMLLYYAFRPTASHDQIQQYWNLYVAEIVPKCFAGSKAELNQACEILGALLSNNGQPKVWDENKANMNGAVKPEDLPCLDPKWIRANISSVMLVFDKLLNVVSWQLNGNGEAPIVRVWRSLMSALAHASSKEVKVSTELMNAVAQIVDQVKRMLNRQESKETPFSPIYQKVDILVNEAVLKIGIIPFLEKRLLLSAHDDFEAPSETPSNRSRTKIGTLNSAAKHLLHLLLKTQQELQTPDYSNLVKHLIHIGLQSLPRRSQLDMLRNFARLSTPDHSEFSLQARVVLWHLLAEYTVVALCLPSTSESHDGSPQYVGREYRDAVKVLENGIHLRSHTISPAWRDVHASICKTVEKEIGLGGILLVTTEPLAEIICKELSMQCDDFILDILIAVLEQVRWPISGSISSLERAQTQLWGSVKGHHKHASHDPLDSLYTLMDNGLSTSYLYVESMSSGTLSALISTVTTVMHSCPSSLRPDILRRLQKGIAVWIEDPKGVITRSAGDLYSKVKKMWALVATLIESVPESSNKFLWDIHMLVTASVSSRHKPILNDAISTWNRTFGCTEVLKYPEELRRALLRLKSVADIELPGFVEDEEDEIMFSPFDFVESQDTDGSHIPQLSNPILNGKLPAEAQVPKLATPSKTLALAQSPNTARDSKSPRLMTKRGISMTPKARLRHDDSQIHFAAIGSSPIASEGVGLEMLTERQREVKERQGKEAAMFPEIRSSPRSVSKATGYSLPRLSLKPTLVPSSQFNADDETSPIFSPDIMMKSFLGSSPTPSSSRYRSIEQESDDGPPSSPPFISSHMQAIREVGLNRDSRPDFVRKMHEDNAANHVLHGSSLLPNAALTEKIEQTDPIDIQTKNLQVLSDRDFMSDRDVFVDAPSEVHAGSIVDGIVQEPTTSPNAQSNREKIVEASPARDVEQADASTPFHVSPPKNQGFPAASTDDKIDGTINSFQGLSSSHISTEEELVTAQLVAEMEHAGSQQAMSVTSSVERSSRKRRRSSTNLPRKKSKSSSASSDSPAAQHTLPSGVDVASCVLVDAAPITGAGQNDDLVAEVKPERALTPPPASAQAAEDKSEHGEQPSADARRSNASQMPAQKAPSVKRLGRPRKIKANVDDLARQHTSPEKQTGVNPAKKARRSDRHSTVNTASVEEETGSVEQHPMVMVDQEVGHQEPETTNARAGHLSAATATANSILRGFRALIDSIKQVALRPEEERQIASVLFESVQQVHEAGRRHGSSGAET